MSNVIQFLESMGSKTLSAAEYAATVAGLEVGDAERKALHGRDYGALNDLLGGRMKVFFGVFAPNEEPIPDDEQPMEDQPDNEPSESAKLS